MMWASFSLLLSEQLENPFVDGNILTPVDVLMCETMGNLNN